MCQCVYTCGMNLCEQKHEAMVIMRLITGCSYEIIFTEQETHFLIHARNSIQFMIDMYKYVHRCTVEA